MVFRRRADAPGQDLVVVSQPGGVLVTGPPGAVESLVGRFMEVAGPGARRAVFSGIADVAALVTTAKGFAGAKTEYLRLTPRSLELIKEYGLSPTGDGSIWGVVRNAKGIAGHLDFEKVKSFSPESAMALQNAAVNMALRAAIAEVQTAIERVEAKLDEVLGLLRADRVGDVLGAKRMLDPLIERVRNQGRISTTDWSSIAALGPDVAQGIEALRSHIRSKLEDADGGWRPGDRADDAERLFERKGLMAESLALLVIAEHNLGAWHELRIAHVRANEPDDLRWTIEAAQAAIALQTEQDQMIVDALRVVADRVTKPQFYDGLAPWQRRELTEARTKLDELTGWFAHQRVLDVAPLGEAPYPSVKESFHHVARGVGDFAKGSYGAVRSKFGTGRESNAPELPPGQDVPVLLPPNPPPKPDELR